MKKPAFKLGLVALSLALLSGCKTMDVNGLVSSGGALAKSMGRTVTPQEEQAMGAESAALLLGAAPLVKNTSLQRYVNQVGEWVAKQSGRSDIQWRFGVLDTDNVNAFAAPAGYVFITKGLLTRLNNEAELAGVLAHEIGHVLKGHYVETMLKKDQAAALGSVANTVAKSQGKAELAPLVNLTRGIYSSGLDKGDEYQADRIGVVLAARAGYDPYGLARVLQMYAGSAGQSGFDLLFSTHPGADDRLDRLATAMGERFNTLEGSSIKNTATFSRQMAALGPTPKRR